MINPCWVAIKKVIICCFSALCVSVKKKKKGQKIKTFKPGVKLEIIFCMQSGNYHRSFNPLPLCHSYLLFIFVWMYSLSSHSHVLQGSILNTSSHFILPYSLFFCSGGAEFKGGLYYPLIYHEGPGGARTRGKTQQDPAAKESLQGVWSGGSFLSHRDFPHVPGNVLPPYIQVTKHQIVAFSTGGGHM